MTEQERAARYLAQPDLNRRVALEGGERIVPPKPVLYPALEAAYRRALVDWLLRYAQRHDLSHKEMAHRLGITRQHWTDIRARPEEKGGARFMWKVLIYFPQSLAALVRVYQQEKPTEEGMS